MGAFANLMWKGLKKSSEILAVILWKLSVMHFKIWFKQRSFSWLYLKDSIMYKIWLMLTKQCISVEDNDTQMSRKMFMMS